MILRLFPYNFYPYPNFSFFRVQGVKFPLHFSSLKYKPISFSLLNNIIKYLFLINIQKISLHCQTCNEPALAFYRKLGFMQVQLIPKYYSIWRISAPDAYRLEFSLQVTLKEEKEEINRIENFEK